MTIRYKRCCGEVETLLDHPDFKVLIRQEGEQVWNLEESVDICSPSCLVEWAWKLKAAQPKLSKSKT